MIQVDGASLAADKTTRLMSVSNATFPLLRKRSVSGLFTEYSYEYILCYQVRVLDEYSPRSYYRRPGVKFYFIELLHEGRWEAPCCYTLLLRHTVDTLCRELGTYFNVVLLWIMKAYIR